MFRYTRLMFGITVAPELFQKIMEQVLSGCEGCMNFIDDIIVYGSTKSVHDSRLEAVMQRLREFNIKLNKGKCVFGAKMINFLGHRLSAEGIKPARDKVLAVKRFREPKTVEEVRSFLGLVNYVGKFIPNLASTSEPLRQLIKKETRFEWNEVHQSSFNTLKQHLSSETTLRKRPKNYHIC